MYWEELGGPGLKVLKHLGREGIQHAMDTTLSKIGINTE